MIWNLYYSMQDSLYDENQRLSFAVSTWEEIRWKLWFVWYWFAEFLSQNFTTYFLRLKQICHVEAHMHASVYDDI